MVTNHGGMNMIASFLPRVILTAGLIFSIGCSKEPTRPTPPEMPTKGLLAFYTFSDNALDESGNDNHGARMGEATVEGVLFIGDNNTDRLSLPYAVLDTLKDFTISAWCRINTIHTGNGGNYLISGARANQPNAFLFGYYSAHNCWYITIYPSHEPFSESATIQDLQWHHVAVVRIGAVAKLYIDGEGIGDGVPTYDGAMDIDLDGFIIGQDQDAVGGDFQQFQSWAGEVDNLRIYNRALSKSEILALAAETGWGS